MTALSSEALVGRDRELRQLNEALNSARLGSGQVLFVTGEAGIGKSRLARETIAQAEGLGLRTMAGRALDADSNVPLRPFTEALLSYFRKRRPPELPELEPYRKVLGQVVPEWGPTSKEVNPLILYEAVTRLLGVIGRDAGLILVLEDLHWADADSLALLEYITDHIKEERILLIATARSDEPSEVMRMFESAAARRSARRIAIGRLSHSQTFDMIRANRPAEQIDNQIVEEVAKKSEGVPFLVEELLAGALEPESDAQVTPVPDSYISLVLRRLDRLDEASRKIIECAAVISENFDESLISEATGIALGQVSKSFKAAIEVGLLIVDEEDPDSSRISFRHSLVPAAILSSVLPSERRRMFVDVAEAIRRSYPGLPREWCERAADLLARGGDLGRASELLVESGRRSLRRGALVTAERSLERARQYVEGDRWKQAGVSRVLVDALALLGRTDRIEEVGASALDFMSQKAGTLGTPDRLADLETRIASGLIEASPEVARLHLSQAVAFARVANDDLLSAKIDALNARLALVDQDLNASELADKALEAGEKVGSAEVRIDALLVKGRLNLIDGRIEASRSFLKEALELADRDDLTLMRIRTLLDLSQLDEVTTGRTSSVERASELASKTEAISIQVRTAAALASMHLARHEIDKAKDALQRLSDISLRFKIPSDDAPLLRMEIASAAGDLVTVGRSTHLATKKDDRTIRVIAVSALSNLLAEDRKRARKDLVNMSETYSRHDVRVGWYLWLGSLLASVEGEFAIPMEAYRPGTVEEPFALLASAVREANTDPQGSLDKFNRSDALLENFPLRRHIARRLVVECALRDNWGTPAEWLPPTLKFFEENELDRVAAACRGLLKRAGARVPRKGRGTSAVPPALADLGTTSRELDVLNLVIDGLTNQEIAERLFLSVRTVETHVGRLIQKLGVRNRTALSTEAQRLRGVK